MTLGSLFPAGARRMQPLAALAYFLAVAGMLWVAGWTGWGLYSDSVDNASLRDRLAELDARMKSTLPAPSGDNTETGSPFIEGATITQAGATLQQRIERAVVRAGGSLLSSQVEFENQQAQAKEGVINLSADVEMAQPAIQGFLYDLEAGMPYLFVETLSVQSPQTVGDEEGAHMHVSIGVSGQWEAQP